MSIAVLVHGAQGRMGTISCQTINQQTDMTLVAATGRGDDLATAIKAHQPDVVVDFTLPDCVNEHAHTIIDHQVCPIIGATGLSAQQIDALTKRCSQEKLGGMIIPNFSIAVTLMMQTAQRIAQYLPHCEIIEMHHPLKVDSPSGTAIKTAELIAQSRCHNPVSKDPSRGKRVHDIPIHSVRLPGYFASQQIIFGNHGETLTISHDATDRAAMMPGLILTIQKVQTLSSMIYGLEHLL